MTANDLPSRLPRIARWDLDKTYLRTEFDSPAALLARAVERADLKRSVPGAAAVLGELARHPSRIHILSGSPRQMRGKLETKLRIDGVSWDELSLKPNLSNLLRLRFRALKDQIGYKLPALLAARARDEASLGARLAEVLVGDDAEADALIYSVYADVVGGRFRAPAVRRFLEAGRAYGDQLAAALEAAQRLSGEGTVRRILIHLDRQTPPSRFHAFGSRVVPFYNYLQAAFVLAELDHLGAEAVLRVAANFVDEHRFDSDALSRSYRELARRGHVDGSLPARLAAAQDGWAASGTTGRATREVLAMVASMGADPGRPEPPRVAPSPTPDVATYLDLIEHARGRRRD